MPSRPLCLRPQIGERGSCAGTELTRGVVDGAEIAQASERQSDGAVERDAAGDEPRIAALGHDRDPGGTTSSQRRCDFGRSRRS